MLDLSVEFVGSGMQLYQPSTDEAEQSLPSASCRQLWY